METTLKERINKEFVEAFKSKNERKKSVLSMLKSKIAEGEKLKMNQELTDDEVMKVIIFSVRQRNQSIAEFKKGGRQDLVDSEKQELEILEQYLPSQMDINQLRKEVLEILGSMEATDPKNKRIGMTMGIMNKKFMGLFNPEFLKKVLEEVI